jgi:hypothetical protein
VRDILFTVAYKQWLLDTIRVVLGVVVGLGQVAGIRVLGVDLSTSRKVLHTLK